MLTVPFIINVSIRHYLQEDFGTFVFFTKIIAVLMLFSRNACWPIRCQPLCLEARGIDLSRIFSVILSPLWASLAYNLLYLYKAPFIELFVITLRWELKNRADRILGKF